MFIQTQATPNQNSLKFLPGQIINSGPSVSFNKDDVGQRSTLASLLLGIKHVKEVFFADDFITISKEEEAQWELMKPEILVTIMDYLVAGRPIMLTTAINDNDSQQDNLDDPIVVQIKEIIESRVRPAVAQDGGDIVFRGFKDGIVQLELRGACSGCPSSSVTLKHGIENMLKHYIPEILGVEEVSS
jgi:Fe-S cluster biogenesis protein NfuA